MNDFKFYFVHTTQTHDMRINVDRESMENLVLSYS